MHSTRLSVATHILICIAIFDGQYKMTSNFLVDSVRVNPVIVRNTLGQLKTVGLVRVEAGVGGASLAKAPKDVTLLDVFRAVSDAMERQLQSVTLQTIIDDMEKRITAQGASA